MTNNKKVGRAPKTTKGQELLGRQGKLARSAVQSSANVKDTVKGTTAPTKQNPQVNSWEQQGEVVGMDNSMRDEAVLVMDAVQGSKKLNARERCLRTSSRQKDVANTKAMNQARAFHARWMAPLFAAAVTSIPPASEVPTVSQCNPFTISRKAS